MRTLLLLISLFVITITATVCASASASASEAPNKVEVLLQTYLQAHPEIPGILLSVDAQQPALRLHAAVGAAQRGSNVSLKLMQPARLASTTKTYVAATLLRLVEGGQLTLDDPVAQWLSKDTLDILTADGYSPAQITLRHLLTHTGGVAEHVNDAFVEAVLSRPQHRWRAAEILQFMTRTTDPLGVAGERHQYADGGYILLGEVIQRATGKTLAASVRHLLNFEQLRLDNTWWEVVEPAPAESLPRISQYLGEVDTKEIHPHFDLHGGGGLVATMADTARFYRALFSGKVFAKPSTLNTMLTSVVPTYGGTGGGQMYCLGVYVTEYRGYTVLYHAGAWGTMAAYVPALDLSLAFSIGMMDTEQTLWPLLLALLNELLPPLPA